MSEVKTEFETVVGLFEELPEPLKVTKVIFETVRGKVIADPLTKSIVTEGFVENIPKRTPDESLESLLFGV